MTRVGCKDKTSDRRRRASSHDVCRSNQSGLTLVEVLVALLLLGVVLSATAAALIGFSRAAISAERRVQATAVLNRVHEEFQAASWDDVGTLETDLTDVLAGVLSDPVDPLRQRIDESATPPTFDGADVGVADSSLEFVFTANVDAAATVYQPLNVDDREYGLFQFVNWVDRTGDGAPDIKRLTAVLRWEILGRTFEQEFVSERAPSVREAGEFGRPRLLQFDVFPTAFRLVETTTWMDVDGESVDSTDRVADGSSVAIALRFNREVTDVRVRFPVISADHDGVPVIVIEEVGIGVAAESGTYFELPSLVLSDYRFPWGPVPLEIEATTVPEAGEFAETFQPGRRTINFFCDLDPLLDSPEDCDAHPALEDDGIDEEPGGGGGGGAGAVEVTNVTWTSAKGEPLRIRRQNSNIQRLCEALTVTASLDGYDDTTDSVQLRWNLVTDESRVATMPVIGNVASFVFPANTTDHGLSFNADGDTHAAIFTVEVLRNAAVEGVGSIAPVVFEAIGGNCP